MELHPCSGMYDCLSIFISNDTFPGRHIFDFNQGSGNFHVFRAWDRLSKNFEEIGWPDKNSYVSSFLCASDTSEVIDDLEVLIGTPSYEHKGLPKMTPKVFMIIIIANLLQRHALGREIVDIMGALNDSSWGRDEVKDFSKV
ncbi:hypothetical protein Clocel_2623 [Clostridium cellulovorans 743B]|uniref:T3SS peptide-binding chaperone domain-containing protein n=1 Tax=Clostridium cellulovorans (strain ATCC 35296 / DSM 3052 / OCM 3 / 743B) TaxID=573061 RepID=D9SR98_CLOC7|nr:hypothetical protein Clocel_2623 [Clostridium cellulovorans 743B]